MRTWSRWLGVLTFVLLVTVSIAHAEEEREPVFRGLAWGDPPEALGEYQLYKDDGRKKTYKKVNEDYRLGSVNTFAILYEFLDDRLMSISGASFDAKALERLVNARYGEPDRDGFREKLWESVGPDTQVVFVNQGDFGAMIIMSKSLNEAYETWWNEQKVAEAQSAW